MIVLGTGHHQRTPRAARSGCTACMQWRPRSPTPRAGCAAWC
jgi:hypothetical protein